MAYAWPVVAPVTQKFGSFPNNGINPAGGHTGMDFGTPVGTDVHSPGDGVVVWDGFVTGGYTSNPWWLTDGGGLLLAIDCGDSEPTFIFGHLNQTLVSVGDRVRKGQVIAKTGNTGKWTTGPHLHFEMLLPGYTLGNSTYGRSDPAIVCKENPGALAGNERRVGGATVNRRAEPNTGSAIVEVIQPNTNEVFTGYVIGETVQGINVWYKDAAGYAWAGGFESQATEGLPNLTPAPSVPAVAANERVTGGNGVIRREGPNKNAREVDRFDPDRAITIGGFVRGEDPYGDGNNLWFVGGLSGGYMWTGAFTNPSVDAFKDLTPAAPPLDAVPAYSFQADFDFVEVQPADVSNVQTAAANPGVEVFPAIQGTAVLHWWGDPALGIAMSSPINEFKRPSSFKSAHFVVGEDRIVQLVSLKDRAYHAGAGGNGWIGIEIDPRAAGMDDVAKRIQANVIRLLDALAGRYGAKLALTLHKDVPGNNTSCSGLSLASFSPAPPVTPAPEPAPAPKPEPVPEPWEPAWDGQEIRDFMDWLVDKYITETKGTK